MRHTMHETPMLSIDALFFEDKIPTWASGECVVQPKLDGVALELVYDDGKLTVASLRGDGTVGEIVTEQASEVEGVQALLHGEHPAHVVIRGEVTADASVKGSRRHVASGRLRSKTADRSCLRFHGYTIAAGFTYSNEAEAVSARGSWGFVTPLTVTTMSKSDVVHAINVFTKMAHDFQSDGVVVKVADVEEREHYGFGPRAPRWAFAWKNGVI